VAGPLTDTLSASFSVLHDERDGFVEDPLDGEEYNDENTTVMRLKSVWRPNDRFEAVFSADYTQEDVALTLGRAEAPLVSIDLADGSAVPRFVPSNDEWDFETSTSLGDRDGQETDHWGVNLTMAYDLSDTLTLKSITAYRDLESQLFIDIDATTLELGDVFVGIDQDQFSQELQLLGNNGSNLNWVLGAYYLEESVPSYQEAYADDFLLFTGFPVSFLRTIEDDLQTKSYAVFGQVDWDITDRWTAGLGIRYTYEEKEYARSTSTFSDILGNADPAFAFEDDDDWDAWTPTFTVGYTPSENLNLYGRLARGFKSGGFNGRANSADDVSTFDPETVWSLELGAKAVMLDGRLSANFAVFESRYEDFQARVSVGDGVDFRFPVLNAAELDISGVELEVTWLATERLELAAQVGYLDSEYGDGGFTGSDGVQDDPAFTPEWTGRLAAAYNFALPGGSTVRIGADASYRDDMFLSVENVAALTEDSYWLVNAFAAWTSADTHWNVTAGVRNATDELYRTEGQEFRSVGNIQTAYYGDPRTYSVSLNYRY
jgi:iron complex outermembrane receptor protein